MTRLASFAFSPALALSLVLVIGCGDDTGTGASTQGGSSEGGSGDGGSTFTAGGADGVGGSGGDAASACADEAGPDAPAGASPSEVACTDGCNRNAVITCELGCAETPDCVPGCVSYVDQTGPTAQCEQARLALFQCVADAITAETCSCTAAGGALSCEVCATQKDALAFCK